MQIGEARGGERVFVPSAMALLPAVTEEDQMTLKEALRFRLANGTQVGRL
jgi:hypothetical protein